MQLTRDSLTIEEMLEYLLIYQFPDRNIWSLNISGVHVDSKNQKMWVTLGKRDRYRETSVAFADWARWIRNKRLENIGI